MAKVSVEDVLEHARKFEGELAAYFKNIADNTTRDGVRLIADYMSRHRLRMEGALRDMPAEQRKRLTRIMLPFDPEAADCHCFEGLQLTPDSTASDVLDAAIQLDACLISLFKQAMNETVDPAARDLFESLVRSEERDAVRLKKMKALDYF